MTYTPPGYTGPKTIGEGTHTLRLDELKVMDATKANCQVCYLATYKAPDGAEIQDWMKWGANPVADKIASERMDSLLHIAGLPTSASLKEIVDTLATKDLLVEVKENRGYLNIWSIQAPNAFAAVPDGF